jgi:hypothetical protein
MGETVVFVGMALFSLFIFIMKEKVKKQELEALAKKKQEQEQQKKRVTPSSPFAAPKKVRPRARWGVGSGDAYEIKNKKKISALRKGWSTKSSIKQAFILAEVLKKKDF